VVEFTSSMPNSSSFEDLKGKAAEPEKSSSSSRFTLKKSKESEKNTESNNNEPEEPTGYSLTSKRKQRKISEDLTGYKESSSFDNPLFASSNPSGGKGKKGKKNS